jgi:hypothetical protein
MSRWVSISADTLKAFGHGALVDTAGTRAIGSLDPVDETISAAVAQVRRAISTGNVLDADEEKVPKSLKALTVRVALYALMDRIGMALEPDEKEQRKTDNGELRRITDNRLKVEAPDVAAASGEMQPSGRSVEAVNVPPRLTGRERTGGL